ncbi:MAG: hypothetical protein Q8O82_07890 [Pseudorhodobacter sp.]|nr:hypothetical protein [Pseudorhodobacter sp.]
MIDPSLRDNPGSAATPIRVILPVLMLAVFTISLGFGILLPQLPALVERLLGAGAGGWGLTPHLRRWRAPPGC